MTPGQFAYEAQEAEQQLQPSAAPSEEVGINQTRDKERAMGTETKTPGQIAYEAYCEKREWKSFGGEALPQWEEVRPDIAEAWDYAALSVILLAKGINGP